jgi:hypothetical protein
MDTTPLRPGKALHHTRFLSGIPSVMSPAALVYSQYRIPIFYKPSFMPHTCIQQSRRDVTSVFFENNTESCTGESKKKTFTAAAIIAVLLLLIGVVQPYLTTIVISPNTGVALPRSHFIFWAHFKSFISPFT